MMMNRAKRLFSKNPSSSSTPDPQYALPNLPPPRPPPSPNPPRILIIGAGSRGSACAYAIMMASNGRVVAVAEPVEFKRKQFGERFIWGIDPPQEGMEFEGWESFKEWELNRRLREKNGEQVPKGVDGVLVCTLDHTHADIITALAPLNLHLLCEKPLATNLEDCLRIYASLAPKRLSSTLFGIGHVMRYSNFNALLRKLLLEDEAIGDIIAIEHTEPIGWWHFSHSYVRGNWRKESTSAPSLMTKSCHDMDLILWFLCSPSPKSDDPPHLPSSVSSTGSLTHFKRSRKPAVAGTATNCFSCSAESDCQFSAKKIYIENSFKRGRMGWPLNVAVHDIEGLLEHGEEHAEQKVVERLSEDYSPETDQSTVDSRGWYGRCVFESDNDVCDNQVVNITWEDDFLPNSSQDGRKGRGAKTATFHMVAFTADTSHRFTRVYGTRGEIIADSKSIVVHDFISKTSKTHNPAFVGGGHNGGDHGLACQFMLAIDAVKNHGMSVAEAQRVHVGCTLEEAIRSHAFVFMAEEARKLNQVIHWQEWWKDNVERRMRELDPEV